MKTVLYKLRKNAKLSQKELCLAIGLCVQTLGLIENGKRPFNGWELMAFSKLFNVPRDVFITNEFPEELLLENDQINNLFKKLEIARIEKNKCIKESIKLLKKLQ